MPSHTHHRRANIGTMTRSKTLNTDTELNNRVKGWRTKTETQNIKHVKTGLQNFSVLKEHFTERWKFCPFYSIYAVIFLWKDIMQLLKAFMGSLTDMVTLNCTFIERIPQILCLSPTECKTTACGFAMQWRSIILTEFTFLSELLL